MMLPVSGVSELVLEVRDMDRAVRFWADILGFPVVERWGYRNGQFVRNPGETDDVWATWLYVGGNTRLGLWLPRNFSGEDRRLKERPVDQWPDDALFDEGGVHVHFALSIAEEDFDRAMRRLRDSGIPVTFRDYADAPPRPHRSLYFKDTEGNVVELLTLPVAESYRGISFKEETEWKR